jgi:hypothetical protein
LVVERLKKLWVEHVASVRRTASLHPIAPGSRLSVVQGRRLDVKLRKEIEDLAQRRMMDFYDADGWQVDDRRVGNPFDAIAIRDDIALSEG